MKLEKNFLDQFLRNSVAISILFIHSAKLDSLFLDFNTISIFKR